MKYLILNLQFPKKSFLTSEITSEILYGIEDGQLVKIKLKKLRANYSQMISF